MIWELELGYVVIVLITALCTGGAAVLGTIWRFSRKTQRYDDALADIEKLDAKMDHVLLELKTHIASASADDKGWRRQFNKLEDRFNRRFNGTG